MKLTEVLKKPKYLALAAASTAAIAFIYAYSQVLGVIENITLWLQIIPWYNAVLVSVFSILFGVTFSFQVYNWFQPKTCKVSKKVQGIGSSGIGTIALFFVAQCPACASLGALFLPLSLIGFLAEYGWLINLFSIGLLIFTLNYLGAFKD
jgi:hypothetical protein